MNFLFLLLIAVLAGQNKSLVTTLVKRNCMTMMIIDICFLMKENKFKADKKTLTFQLNFVKVA